ncbi:MAG: hypothetical protein ACYTEQ_14730 [Planctomycetota bacterium]
MSLEGLLAIAGIVLAVYAIAQPVQRQSISLFVPLWPVPCSILLSAAVLFWRLGVSVFGYQLLPWPNFASTLFAFLLPVGATLWAIRRWCKAKLTKGKDRRFRGFVLTCLREDKFDELVRILERNCQRLTEACKPETVDLLFENRFVQAMHRARTWLHLKLLTNNVLLDLLPDQNHAVGRTLRDLLVLDNSPLRTSALLDEGGDETLHCTDDEEGLINSTFRNPEWYHRCRAGYPVLIAACERIDSGALDTSYNRANGRYGARQGIATRTNCPVFLAEKTIAHALKASIEQNYGTTEDTHGNAADLWNIFRTVYEHSVYRPETWDEPSGYGDYPTPFGFLLAEILSDYYFICEGAWAKSSYGDNPPPEILGPVIRMWACCVIWSTKDEGHVSPRFRQSSVNRLLEVTLQRRQTETHAEDHREARAAWTQVFVENIKDAMTSWLPDSRHYLGEVLAGMDLAKDHIRENRDWLRQELVLDRSGGGLP